MVAEHRGEGSVERRLDGKRVVIVAGAASGIGRATAIGFAEPGTHIVMGDVNVAGLQETATAVRSEGGEVSVLGCDIKDRLEVHELIRKGLAVTGTIDAVVNAVGWVQSTDFLQDSPDYWREILEVNLLGSMHLGQLALREMVRQRRGSVTLVGSDAGKVGTAGQTAYAAAKGGIISLSKSMAREVAKYGVRVNCVAPGLTATPMLAQQDEGLVEKIVRTVPLRRVGQAEEVAAMVVFLASDDASYITGQAISVSGGLTMCG